MAKPVRVCSEQQSKKIIWKKNIKAGRTVEEIFKD